MTTSHNQKTILLGITGGIAAYKSAYLLRLLQDKGYAVQVMMTEAATHFVTPVTFQALSGQPVLTDIWDPRIPNRMAHIESTRQASAMIIAPATTNTLAKITQGLADDLLSTTAIARNCPLLVAPAMNREMWAQPATQRNIEQLKSDGVMVIGPAQGVQACGEVGDGRMEEPEVIVEMLERVLAVKNWLPHHVLLTAGPTWESIDPVRAITNHSSGKMGYALAQALLRHGAKVTLVSGPVSLPVPLGAEVIRVTSAHEMYQTVMAQVKYCDVFFSVAAVADYTPAHPQEQKMKKKEAALTLDLVPTEDILATVAKLPNAPFCVGFAAETQYVEEFAKGKRLAKNIPVIIANVAQQALGQDDNQVVIIDDQGQHELVRADKAQIAEQIIQHIIHLIH